jgi:hypothetical protein
MARLLTRSKGAASRRHLHWANRSLLLPLIDDSDSNQDVLSFSSISPSRCHLHLLAAGFILEIYSFYFWLLSMFNLC